MSGFKAIPPQRKSNALVIAAGSLMNDPQVHRWLKRQLVADDLGGVDVYAIETAHVEHVPPSNRLRIALDTDMRHKLRTGDVPPILVPVHIAGSIGSIDANGANSGLAVAEALHLLSREFVWPQLERIHSDLLGRARPEDKELVLYVLLSAASNTGRGSLIPLAVSAARLRDRLARTGVDALLVGLVMLPGRVDGSGATMRERFDAQGVASMLELFAYESAVRKDEQDGIYQLGGEPIKLDRCLFDFLIPISSTRLEPTELSRRSAALLGLLLADGIGVGQRLRTDRVRLTAGDMQGPGPRLTPMGYGGAFLDHAALLDKAGIQICDELFERFCQPGEGDLGGQLFENEPEHWFEKIVQDTFPKEPVDAVEARGDSPEDIEQARADTEATAYAVYDVLTRRRPRLVRALEAALNEAIDEHLASGRQLGDFSEQLAQVLGVLSDIAQAWLDSADTRPPTLASDLDTVNADLEEYAQQLTDDVWKSVAASVLHEVVRRFGSVVRNVASVLRSLTAELDEAVMSNRVRLKYFDGEAQRNEIPGLIDLWRAPGAYEAFFNDKHPFRLLSVDGDTEIDEDYLRRFLLPVRDRLVQGFRDGRQLDIEGCLLLATELHFQPELDRVQVGHFLKEYVTSADWFGQVLTRAITASEPLVDLKPGNATRDRIFYVEVPENDPMRDALYDQVCRGIDSPRVRPLQVFGNRLLPAVLIFQVMPNLPFGELQLLASNGAAMDAFERHDRISKMTKQFPLHTDQQLVNLVKREIRTLADLSGPPPWD